MGEGSVTCYRNDKVKTKYVKVAFVNSHLGALESIKNFLGYGKIYQQLSRNQNHKQMYQLQIGAESDVLHLLEHVLLFVIIKREKVIEAIRFLRLKTMSKYAKKYQDIENRKFKHKLWSVS